MWNSILGFVKKIFSGAPTQVGSRNQSASDVTVGNNASIVAVGQGITVNESPRQASIPFADLEKQLPELFAEMREDLTKNPFVREFVLLGEHWVYNSDPNKPIFHYFYEKHGQLRNKIRILENYNLVRDINSTRSIASCSPKNLCDISKTGDARSLVYI